MNDRSDDQSYPERALYHRTTSRSRVSPLHRYRSHQATAAYITGKLRMMMYCHRLITGTPLKLALLVYRLLLKDVPNNVYNHKWITSVKSVFDDAGCS